MQKLVLTCKLFTFLRYKICSEKILKIIINTNIEGGYSLLVWTKTRFILNFILHYS